MATRYDDADERRYSIWIFIGAFSVLLLIGLVVVLIVGSPTSDSRSVRTAKFQEPHSTEPLDPDDGSGVSTTTTAPPSVTMPDGSPAPAGVRSVTLDDGVLTLSFAIDKTGLSSTLLAKVPPMTAIQGDSPDSLLVTIECSSSRREQLSQLIVTESDESVRVSAVVLVPTNATGCNPNLPPTRLTLPLSSPLGARPVTVESQDLDLPTVDLDTIDD